MGHRWKHVTTGNALGSPKKGEERGKEIDGGFGKDAGARMETSNKGRALGSPKKGFGRGREDEIEIER